MNDDQPKKPFRSAAAGLGLPHFDELYNREEEQAADVPPREPAEAPIPVVEITSVKEFCRAVLNSRDYQQHLYRCIRNDELSPQVETLLYAHAFGKPVDVAKVEISDTSVPVESQSVEQLEQRISQLHDRLRQLRRAQTAFADDDVTGPVQ